MTQSSRIVKSGVEEVPPDLIALGAALQALPTEYRLSLDPLYDRVVESTRRRRRILALVQEALGQLRLDMKYLVFDLEATRRERDDYQRQLKEPDEQS